MGFLVAHPSKPDEIARQLVNMLTQVRAKKMRGVPDKIRNNYTASYIGKQMLQLL